MDQPNSESLVTVAVALGVATITLNSPANRNALSRRLLADLNVAIDRAERPAVRVVILRHEGPAFCAGMDLRERIAGSSDDASVTSGSFVRVLQRLESMAAVTIAAVEGAVRAGGVGLMAACDLVVTRPEVTFAFSEVRIGVAPAVISRPVLRRAPWSAVAAAFLTGETFDAEAARAMGLITHVSDDVAATAATLAAGVLQGAPGAVAATKRLLRTDQSGHDYLTLQAQSDELFAGPEGQEGMQAFLDKRPPSWVG